MIDEMHDFCFANTVRTVNPSSKHMYFDWNSPAAEEKFMQLAENFTLVMMDLPVETAVAAMRYAFRDKELGNAFPWPSKVRSWPKFTNKCYSFITDLVDKKKNPNGEWPKL